MIIAGIAAIVKGLILCVSLLIKKGKGKAVTKTVLGMKRTGVILCGLMVVMLLFTMFSQFTVETPPILNNQGTVLKGSIAELTRFEINGRKEWIAIRGENAENPIGDCGRWGINSPLLDF